MGEEGIYGTNIFVKFCGLPIPQVTIRRLCCPPTVSGAASHASAMVHLCIYRSIHFPSASGRLPRKCSTVSLTNTCPQKVGRHKAVGPTAPVKLPCLGAHIQLSRKAIVLRGSFQALWWIRAAGRATPATAQAASEESVYVLILSCAR